VGEERAAALKLLNDFPRRPWLAGRGTVEVVAWDDPLSGTPMDATRTPQESVTEHHPSPSACDLTIVILFGRLGTRLPPTRVQPDGNPHLSGTHWELEDARRKKRPVWIYHRRDFRLSPKDPEHEAKMAQFNALDTFLGDLRADDGSLLGGINEYDESAEFSTMLEKQFEAELRRVLDESSALTGADGRFKIFLANTADDLTKWRGRLRGQLSAIPNVSLLAELPPPFDEADHRVAAREMARQADLSVHFAGCVAGRWNS